MLLEIASTPGLKTKNPKKIETIREDEYCFLGAVLKILETNHNINMDFPHLKNLFYTHILENQNHYAEFHFEILTNS